MMDHERTVKELQETFEEIQYSYKTLMDNAFTLQERTLELARTLFEGSAEKTQDILIPQPYCNPSAKRFVYPAHGVRSDHVEEAKVSVHGLDNRHTTTPVLLPR